VSDMQVFFIGYKSDGQDSTPRFRISSKDFLSTIAAETGGQVFYPQTDADFQQATKGIMKRLHSEYLI
jgi:hypothetical protein